jgi:superfamily II DNA/RNA helicase
MDADEKKWPWLVERLYDFMKEGSVLVFVSTKQSAEELQVRLNNIPDYAGKVAAIHGDKTQNERTKIMHAFKSGSLSVLVATDVAARGLDIKSIKTVVNYFMPRDIDSYVHRIGRTGRAGDKTGVAYALITRKETFFAGELVKVLEGANQRVPPDLMNIAMQNNQFRKQRTGKYQGRRAGPGRGRGRGGRGGGRGGGRDNSLNPLQPRHTAGIGYDTSKEQPRSNNANNNTNSDGSSIMSSLNQAIIRDIMTKMPLPTEDYNPDQPTEEYDPSEPSEEVPKQPTYAYTPLTAVNRAQVFKEAMNSRFKSSFVRSNDDEDKKWASNYQPPRK